MEALLQAERLFTTQTEKAPENLAITIKLAMNALRRDSKGEALNEIRKADKIVADNNLEAWKAEMHAVWAVFHYHMKNEKEMLIAIRNAQRQESNNERIEALRQVILNKE